MKSLFIIGAGPGGYECAVKAAKAGLDVHIVDKADRLGGTRLNEGCIPTKALCHSAELIESARAATSLGLTVEETGLDLKAAISRKDEVTASLREGIASLLRSPGITFHEGVARFAAGNPHVLLIEDESYQADYVIIATGSEAKRLPIPGCDAKGVITSREMLKLTEIPRRLCIIGGGVIGMEFACIFRTFGSEVTVIEYAKEILPGFDKDLSKRLRTILKKKGIEFITGAPVTAIRRDETSEEIHVCYEHRSAVQETTSDLVLMATGRGAKLDTLNFEEAGIAITPRGVVVNEHMETSVPGVYAVGDINGRCQLAHAATHQSYCALSHILGKPFKTNLSIIPAAVFTSPELAMVGLTEEAAAARYGEVDIHKSYYRANGRALAIDAPKEGFIKIISTKDGKLVGAHVLGSSAAELIHEAALLMNLGGKMEDLRSAIHAHPTLSELWIQE